MEKETFEIILTTPNGARFGDRIIDLVDEEILDIEIEKIIVAYCEEELVVWKDESEVVLCIIDSTDFDSPASIEINGLVKNVYFLCSGDN